MKVKEKRLLEYMEENHYDAVVIGRQDNFSWLTCGGQNKVLITSETGVSILVFTRDHKYVIANTMDGQRLMEEEMEGMEYTLISLKWYEKSKEETAITLLKGKKVLSDIPLPGFDFKPDEFLKLHYPLTDNEVEKYTWLGRKAEEILRRTADCIKPGMSEQEIAELLICEYAAYDITGAVILIGSDDRIAKYRHPTPSGKKVDQLLLMAPAIQKWGLTVPLSRMVYFGDKLPLEVEKKYDAICRIEAHTFADCVPGMKFAKVLEIQKKVYAETGYADEWQQHFQGGLTGYVVNNPTKCMDPKAEIQERQTFNWYITVTGTKVEETMMTAKSGKTILTSTGLWPLKKYEAEGEIFELPQILMK